MIKQLANIISMANLGFGVLSLCLTLSGKLSLAALMILISVCLDYLDGWTARRFGIESLLGKNLDSLSDIISFGVAPALLINAHIGGAFGVISAMIFIMCGAYRLARFNSLDVKDYFVGLPITFAGGIVGLLALLFGRIGTAFWVVALLLLSLLMISVIKVKKIGTKSSSH